MRIFRRIRYMVTWSPLLLAAAAVCLLLSLRQNPAPVAYLIACVGIGLLFGGLIILDYLKTASSSLSLLYMMIFAGGHFLTRSYFFPGVAGLPVRETFTEYLLIVLVTVLGIVVVLRRRIIRFFAQVDVDLEHRAAQ